MLSSKVQNPLKPLGVCNATVKILCYRRLGQSQRRGGEDPHRAQKPTKPPKPNQIKPKQNKATQNHQQTVLSKLTKGLSCSSTSQRLIYIPSTSFSFVLLLSPLLILTNYVQHNRKYVCMPHIMFTPSHDDNYEKEIRMLTPHNCDVYP